MKHMNKLEETRRNRKKPKKRISFAAFKTHMSKTGMKSASIALSLVMLVSSLPVISLTAFADEPNNSQTKYTNINDYQNSRIVEIQKEIFFHGITDASELATDAEKKAFARLQEGKPLDDTKIPDEDGKDTEDDYESLLERIPVREGNKYFNWKPQDEILDENGEVCPEWNGMQNYVIPDKYRGANKRTPLSNLKFKKNATAVVTADSDLPKVTIEVDATTNREFTVFNVENPRQFRYAMEYGTINNYKEKATEVKGIDNYGKNILINITKDLNMAGYKVNADTPKHPLSTKNDQLVHSTPYIDVSASAKPNESPNTITLDGNCDWESIDYRQGAAGQSRVIYIEGNGHTLYNLRTSDNGLISVGNTRLIVKNFCIANSLVINTCKKYNPTFNTTGLLVSHTTATVPMYLYNVHTENSFVENYNALYVSGLIGRRVSSSGTFVKNCSANSNIVIGGDHVGGVSSNIQAKSMENVHDSKGDEIDIILPQTQGKDNNDPISYNVPFPEKPEKIIFDYDPDTNIKYYPNMFENSYSVDCELFSLGVDSGAFISCGIGIVARNCYTNNNIYADTNTGAFIGRASSRLGIYAMKDDADDGDHYTISNFFENCYSSGIVEGRNAMGGFAGYVQGIRNIAESYKINPYMDNTVHRAAYSYDSNGNRKGNTDQDEWDNGGKYYFNITRQTYVKSGNNWVLDEDVTEDDKLTNCGANIFHNCYSSASVGMDYAGRYCGGFTGMDQAYSLNTTVKIDGTTYKFNGTGYFNCYATGEVGNILTVTDDGKAADLEKYYLADTNNGEGADNANKGATKNVEILDYYPTGGFIGVLAPDRWWVAVAGNYKNTSYPYFTPNNKAEETFTKNNVPASDYTYYKIYDKNFGFFNNCFYDMQTTAMREMAVGIAGGESAYAPDKAINYTTGEPEPGSQADNYADIDFTFGTCDGKTEGGKAIAYQDDINAARKGQTVEENNGEIAPYSLVGVTGLYTTTAEEKGIMGLTNMTEDSKLKMEASGDDWRYEHGYYPQLAVFSDANVESSGDDQEKSVFWIKDNNGISDNNTVTGGANGILSDGMKLNGERACEGSTFQNTTMIMRAYRYSQASTAAVVLNNYNFIMDADGSLMNDNDWAVAQPNNQLTWNENTGFYEVGYRGLNAGQYEFKIQANDSMTYNYGATRFDDPTNCVINVEKDNSDVKIQFKFDRLFSSDYLIIVDVTNDGKNTYHQVYGKDNSIRYSVIGSFTNSWGDDLFLEADASDKSKFTAVKPFTEDDIQNESGFIKHEFKVRGNQNWNDANYGYDGVFNGTNMSFILKQACTVKFEFDENTHKCKLYIQQDGNWIEADDESVKDICPESSIADYTNYEYNSYTIVSDKKVLTGHRWGDAQNIDDKKVSAQAGVMSKLGDGVTFTKILSGIPTGANYQMRILPYDTTNTWALDSTDNKFFHISKSDPAAADEKCTLTITYNSDTKEITYNAVADGKTLDVKTDVESEKYVVAGDEGITGYRWLGSDTTIIPAADKDNGPTKEEIQDYIQKAQEKGEMKPDQSTALGLYQWRSEGTIRAGAHSFKVFADGDINLGFGENGGANDIKFSLKEDSGITIIYNSQNHAISISADMPGALEMTQYVVTGTEKLMGSVWNLQNAVMDFNIDTGLYEYKISGKDENGNSVPITGGENYAFKVIEFDKDSGNNISFRLLQNAYIKVTYDPRTAKTSYDAYSDPECTEASKLVRAEAIGEVLVESYSVLGEKGLTGYTWLGLQENGQPYEGDKRHEMEGNATEAGKLKPVKTAGEGRHLYSQTFYNVEVGINGNFKSYAFKVAANGNWDSGISYGNGNDNYIIALNNPGSKPVGDPNYNHCDVTITFDEDAAKRGENCISVETSPKEYLMNTINTEGFNWYLVGDQRIASYEDSFRGPDTTYDTVRDITQTINFTNGAYSNEKGIAWSIDAETNLAEGYITKLGGKVDGTNDGSGFSLDYKVDNKDVRVNFNEDVVDLDTMIDEPDKKSDGGYEAETFPKDNGGVSTYTDGVDANIEKYLDVNTLLNDEYWTNYTNYKYYPITYTSERFMPGKQFLKVSTYGVGTVADFNRWKRVRLLYDQLTLRGEDLDKKAQTLLLLIDSDELNSTAGGTIIERLNNYLKTMKDSDPEQYAHYTEGFDFVDRYSQWKQLHTALQNYKKDSDFKNQFLPDAGSSEMGTDVIPLDAPYVDEVQAVVTGSRLVRLIPKGYIEAGNDAVVTVIDDIDHPEKSQNVVMYDPKNSTSDVQVTVKGTDDNYAGLDNTVFSYYNFALMAGYAITDKIGLGIYDNYSNQHLKEEDVKGTTREPGIVKLNTDENNRRSEDSEKDRTTESYYAMTAAINESASYDDNTTTTNEAGETKVTHTPNLTVSELVNQELIGDSSKIIPAGGSDDDAKIGKTIVKVYQVLNKGKSNETERIVYAKKSETTDSASNINFNKWTGQQLFESSDDGDYRVKFYWAMNDGRYFTDTKDVQILANTSGIRKKVDKPFDDPACTYNPKTNELTYTLKYTNSVSSQPVTFAILDVLPFVGDERINKDMTDTSGSIVDVPNANTTLANGEDSGTERKYPDFTITKLEITREGNQNTKKAEIKGVYVSSSENVGELLYDTDTDAEGKKIATSDAAGKLGVLPAPPDIVQFTDEAVTDSAKREYLTKIGRIDNEVITDYGWKALQRGAEGTNTGTDGVYTFKEGSNNANFSKNVKAVAVTGIQLASADSVTVDITLKFDGKPNDDLFNNAYFHSSFNGNWDDDAKTVTGASTDSGYSENTRTTIVGRDLSGIVWLDSNVNGQYDPDDEPKIENVAVELVKITKTDDIEKQEVVASQVTGTDGAYNFNDEAPLASGDYKVLFKAPSGNTVTLHYPPAEEGGAETTQTRNFSDLFISKIISEANLSDNNIAKISKDTGDEKAYYINQTFPTAGDIFTYSYADAVNVVKNNFVYTKSRQNLALTDAYGSITIEKYKDNDNTNPMSGVKFKIEYQDGDDWKPLVYNTDGFIDSPDSTNLDPDRNTGEYTTDAKGTISVDKLLQTTYRITEIELPATPAGEKDPNPLIKPIYITIPYELANGEKPDSNSIISLPDDPAYTKDGKNYYRDVTITLSNTTELNDYLPLTGSTEGFNYWIPIAGLIFVIIGAGVIYYAVKRKKAKNSGCK